MLFRSAKASSSSTRFAVGAPNADISSFTDSGKVYIYDVDLSFNITQDGTYLSASDKASGDKFGASIAIKSDATRIFVGAPSASYLSYTKPGKVYIFDSGSSTGWVRQTISGLSYLKANDRQDNDYFGSSISVDSSGNRLVVGAPKADISTYTDAGKVYIFNSSSGGWTQEVINGYPFISASDKAKSDNFGSSVEISADGNTIIVGSPSADPTLADSGKVYIYVSGSNGWIEQKIYSNPFISASDKVKSDNFGSSVSISSNGKRIRSEEHTSELQSH